MSYILDALRKAERDRPRAVIGTPAPPPAAPAPWLFRHWPWLVATVIAVNAGVLIWITLPSLINRGDSPVDVREATPSRPAATDAAGERPVRAVAPPPPAAPMDPVPSAPRPPEPRLAQGAPAFPGPSRGAPAPAPRSMAAPAAPLAPPRPAPAPERSASLAPAIVQPSVPPGPAAVAPRTAAPPSAASPAPPPAARPSGPQGAPAGVETRVRQMKLQFLVYSDVPSERLVFIDNQKFIEGQTIASGIVLERIDPNGAVVTHEGRRFVLRADPRASR